MQSQLSKQMKLKERTEKKFMHNKKLMKVYSNATIFKVYKKDNSP